MEYWTYLLTYLNPLTWVPRIFECGRPLHSDVGLSRVIPRDVYTVKVYITPLGRDLNNLFYHIGLNQQMIDIGIT